jgi:hypothetical protein
LLTTSNTDYLNKTTKSLNNNVRMNTQRRWRNMLKNECKNLTIACSKTWRKKMGLTPIILDMFTWIHVFQCLVPPFPWVHGQEEPQACAMLCVTCRGHICLIMFHGLQGFLNYMYFNKGYQVH